MVLTRIFVLEKLFSKNELLSLDDELPNIKKLLKPAKPTQLDLRKMNRLRKSRMKKKKNGKSEADEEETRVMNNVNGTT